MRMFYTLSFLFIFSTLNAQWADWTYEPNGVFARGDANNDGVVDVSDPTYILTYKFMGGPAPIEMDSGDANDDGVVDMSDSIYLNDFLFSGGPQPLQPFSDAGTDDTEDILQTKQSPQVPPVPPKPQFPPMTSRETGEDTTPPTTPSSNLPIVGPISTSATTPTWAINAGFVAWDSRVDTSLAVGFPAPGNWNTRMVKSINNTCPDRISKRMDVWNVVWMGDSYSDINKKSSDSITIDNLCNALPVLVPGQGMTTTKRKIIRVKISITDMLSFMDCDCALIRDNTQETITASLGYPLPPEPPVSFATVVVELKAKNGDAVPVVIMQKYLEVTQLLGNMTRKNYGSPCIPGGLQTGIADVILNLAFDGNDVVSQISNPTSVSPGSAIANKDLYVYRVRLLGLCFYKHNNAFGDLSDDEYIQMNVKCEVKYKLAQIGQGDVLMVNPFTCPF